MTLNDYTHHICDRFILLFIAFVGLIGTSYIIISGNLDCRQNPAKDVTTIFQSSFQQPIGIKQVEEDTKTTIPVEEEVVTEEMEETFTVSD